MPGSPVNRLTVLWGGGEVTAGALKTLRELSTSAMSMGLPELSNAIRNGTPIELGLVSENSMVQKSQQLERAGFIIQTEQIS